MTSAPTLADLEGLTPHERQSVERRLVAPHLDSTFYVTHYGATMAKDGFDDPVAHFCATGWEHLLKPSPDFDTWWYWANYLDPATATINPLLHYIVEGREHGNKPIPPYGVAPIAAPLPSDRPVRRATLFAFFDTEGQIDESVIVYLRDLSRFSDVFFLADGFLDAEELAKVSSVTEGAWAIRHGAYDFGSYSMLARDLVGWERLEAYDEVLFVNDSCFLVRPLDEVFTEMAERPSSWWGLQATKGIAKTRDQRGNDFADPIPLDTVRARLLPEYERDPIYDFLVGSYFLAFRRPVLDDPQFRALIDSVHEQPSKLLVIQKYEVGLTHLLIGRGFGFDTFITALYPFHPVFTSWYFELLRKGFPLLKRYFLYQNHYDVPGLAEWKSMITAVVPDAPVGLFEATLVRTSPADRLARSLSLTAGPDGEAVKPKFTRGKVFRKRDAGQPKDPACWVFATDRVTGLLPASLRALLEEVRDDSSIRKVVLTRDRSLELRGSNLELLPLLDSRSRDVLYRAGAVFVRSNPRGTVQAPIRRELRVVVASRDGLTLTPAGAMNAAPVDPSESPIARPGEPAVWLHELVESPVTGFAASSAADLIAAANDHAPALYGDGWLTGIPAHDLLTRAHGGLPDDLAAQEMELRSQAGGRQVVLLIPAAEQWRTGFKHPEFTSTFRRRLGELLKRTNSVLAIREPFGDYSGFYRRYWPEAINASYARFSSTQAVLRAADVVWTDIDSSALDATIRGVPVLSFIPDPLPAGATVYNLRHLFPGFITDDEESFVSHLEQALGHPESAFTPQYERFRNLFLDFRDDQSSARVLAKVRAELDGRDW